MRELTLQRRLGHASPEATRVYTRVSDPIVVAEYRRALGLGLIGLALGSVAAIALNRAEVGIAGIGGTAAQSQ